MSAITTIRETLDDLYREKDKAELIGGRIKRLMPSGDLPSLVAFEIATYLRSHARSIGWGKAYADGVGYTVPMLLSGRESFSPDASWYEGPPPANRMRFIEGVPSLAVEVRGENDYTPSAEREIAAKREDYFQAGTQVVWDVDPIAETITSHVSGAQTPVVFRRGDVADAEPAVPGWRLAVADAFDV